MSRIIHYDWEYNTTINNGIPNTRPKYFRHPSILQFHNDTGFHSHGVQSATTIAGRYHGFANKAKYIQFPRGLGLIQCTIYYNDFHKNKKNPNTGWPNRTINAAQQGSNGRWNKLLLDH